MGGGGGGGGGGGEGLGGRKGRRPSGRSLRQTPSVEPFFFFSIFFFIYILDFNILSTG